MGLARRTTGATQMNSNSSRSHTIFSLCVEARGEDEHIRAGKLNLVDLAGSEKQAKSGVTGDQQKESIKINLSLHFLGKVISKLAEGKKQHVPHLESNLTKLLKDSLGGQARTLMVACVSPADYNYEETLSTLRFASRAKKVVNKPVINEDPKDALLKVYQAEIRELKSRLAEGGSGIPDPDLWTQMEEKHRMVYETMKTSMQMEQERKMKELQQQIEEQTQREKQLKARLDTEIGEKRELQADRERAEELRICLERDLEAAKVEGERQIEEERRRASLMNQDKEQEMKRLEPSVEQGLTDKDEELARIVQRIAQQDYSSYLKRKESKAWFQERKKAVTNWACNRCTFINKPDSWRCKMCGARWTQDEDTGKQYKHRDGKKQNPQGVGPKLLELATYFSSWTQTKNTQEEQSQIDSALIDENPGCATSDSDVKERRIVLFGRNRSGKSTTGNNILGEHVFEVSSHEKSVTKKSQRRTGSRFGRNIEIIDSPGIFDGKMSNADIRLEVGKCVWMTAPGPHAFVFVVPVGCFAQEDQNIVENIMEVFGTDILNYLIVLFTKKDDLSPDELTLGQYLERVPVQLKHLLKSCNNRCVAFNNKGTPDERDADVKEFLDLADTIFSDNGGHVYTNDMWAKAEKFMEGREGQLEREYQQNIQRKKDNLRSEYDKKTCKARKNQNDIISLLQDRIDWQEKEEISRMSDTGTDNPSNQIEDWKQIIKQVEEMNDRETKQWREEGEKKQKELDEKEAPNFRNQARLEVQNWQKEPPGVQEILDLVSNLVLAVGGMVRRILFR